MLHITNLTKRRPPAEKTKLPFKKIKEEVLGKKYDLSLVFCGNALMKKLNKTYHNKNKAASVLSFNLSEEQALLRQGFAGQGEIFINFVQKEHSPLYLFIHALLHLKGFKHSAKMKEREDKIIKKYPHGTQCRYRA